MAWSLCYDSSDITVATRFHFCSFHLAKTEIYIPSDCDLYFNAPTIVKYKHKNITYFSHVQCMSHT